ncbi:MAG: sulfatase-like hydrolase/transferase [Opitutales bacterium]|nr:sulfatase-like hydrolase/transferase [Opitutales bacterium]MBT5814736.1 sulfatase-like hydrolase/transferase [Opitutales bacterium]
MNLILNMRFPINSLVPAILAILSAIQTNISAAQQPNIILIMADDLSPEMYGCYGAKDANTPNLDRLAREGVQFRTAWGTALCSPAREQIEASTNSSPDYFTRTRFSNSAFAE